jgi:hypothetical protein
MNLHLLAILAALTVIGSAAGAQQRQPVRQAVEPIARSLICDPLNLLPGCHIETKGPNGAATTKPVELDVWQKLVNSALPDLEYASAQAAAAGTPAAAVRKQCWDAIILANRQASGANVKDASGNALTKPDPHVFVDVEGLAELLDNLAPNGPLWTACSGAAGLAKTNALTFINSVVAGAAGLAALGVT